MQYKKYALFAMLFIALGTVGLVLVGRDSNGGNNFRAQLDPVQRANINPDDLEFISYDELFGGDDESGGSSGGTGGSPSCSIESEPESLCLGTGGSAVLSWDSLDVPDGAIGSISPTVTIDSGDSLGGTALVSPQETTTYTMTLRSKSNGTLDTCSTAVSVVSCGQQAGSGILDLGGGQQTTQSTSTDSETGGENSTIDTSTTNTSTSTSDGETDTTDISTPPDTDDIPPLYTLTQQELSSGK